MNEFFILKGSNVELEGAPETISVLPLGHVVSSKGEFDVDEESYIKSASQSGITKASKVFMLDAVIDEDRDKLTKDMEENPGIAITIGNKLTEILGLTNTANLKKL